MIPIEEIRNEIASMGYILIERAEITPSYYKLNDGTIIETLIRIDSIVEDKSTPSGFFVRTSNSIKAYVPKDKRTPEKFVRFNPGDLRSSMVENDVPYEELLSNFSNYELSNGVVVSVRTVVSQVRKSSLFTKDGEPIYSVDVAPPITKFTKKQT